MCSYLHVYRPLIVAAHKSNGAMALCYIQLNKNTMQRLDYGKLANMAQASNTFSHCHEIMSNSLWHAGKNKHL